MRPRSPSAAKVVASGGRELRWVSARPAQRDELRPCDGALRRAYTARVAAAGRSRAWQEALRLLEELPRRGVEPDATLLAAGAAAAATGRDLRSRGSAVVRVINGGDRLRLRAHLTAWLPPRTAFQGGSKRPGLGERLWQIPSRGRFCVDSPRFCGDQHFDR